MSYNSLYIVLLLFISSIFCSIRIAPDPCTQLDNYLQQLTPKTVTYNKCRNTSPVANFNPSGISGKWYLYQMYNFANDMIDLTCSTDNFVQVGNVLNYTGLFIFKNGTILPLIQNQFPLSQFRTGEITFPAFGLDLKVVDTDYNSYILWHACYTDSKSGSQFERVVLATRSLAPVSDVQDAQFDRLIAQKIFNNVSPIQIPPYGRCNCYKI